MNICKKNSSLLIPVPIPYYFYYLPSIINTPFRSRFRLRFLRRPFLKVKSRKSPGKKNNSGDPEVGMKRIYLSSWKKKLRSSSSLVLKEKKLSYVEHYIYSYICNIYIYVLKYLCKPK